MNRNAKWTIMVYIAADGELASFAIESLKQLRDNVGNYDDLVVAAQWDLDGQRKVRPIRRKVFEGKGCANTPLVKDSVALDRSADMAHGATLKDFIKSVYDDPRCKADHYCLVLWGHGPELFLEAAHTSKEKNIYLAPVELRKALEEAYKESKEANKLDIIGMDACSMSAIEFAGELEGLADYMVASQEEVPDMSFPYNRILELFSKSSSDIAELCQKGVRDYMLAYEDYVFAGYTGIKPVTISALRLEKLSSITMPICNLTQKLRRSIKDKSAREAIIASRADSKGFVAGLFVDLRDFCEQLSSKEIDDEVKDACLGVCEAIKARGDDACLVENKSEDSRSHGLSIYFPYLTNQEKIDLDKPLVKGGLDTLNKGGLDTLNKGGLDTVNKAAADVLMDARKKMIQDFEKQYNGLQVARTHWYEFIANDWSRILAEIGPADLDVRYSSQQCFWNLLAKRS